MSEEWRELSWDDAMRRGYEALRGGEALYEEIDAEQGRSNIDSRSTCGALSSSSPKPTPGLPWRGSWAGNGTTTAVPPAEHRSCPLRPQTSGRDLGGR
jgi:hypothetical protein